MMYEGEAHSVRFPHGKGHIALSRLISNMSLYLFLIRRHYEARLFESLQRLCNNIHSISPDENEILIVQIMDFLIYSTFSPVLEFANFRMVSSRGPFRSLTSHILQKITPSDTAIDEANRGFATWHRRLRMELWTYVCVGIEKLKSHQWNRLKQKSMHRWAPLLGEEPWGVFQQSYESYESMRLKLPHRCTGLFKIRSFDSNESGAEIPLHRLDPESRAYIKSRLKNSPAIEHSGEDDTHYERLIDDARKCFADAYQARLRGEVSSAEEHQDEIYLIYISNLLKKM